MLLSSFDDAYHVDVEAIICLHKRKEGDDNFSLEVYLSCLKNPVRLMQSVTEREVDKKISDISKQKDSH
jgi:hypothetical protein